MWCEKSSRKCCKLTATCSGQIAPIARCTADPRLRNALLLAATEEYCLRPVCNKPLLVYRFVNYLRRTQRGGLTQVPTLRSAPPRLRRNSPP